MRRTASFRAPPVSVVVLVAVASAVGGCAEDVLRQLTTKTDEFTQNLASKVDILWVVDSSESMSEEQTALGQNFQTFIQGFLASGVDYHIGVISMDPATGGALHAPTGAYVIDNTTTNPQQTFLQNVRVGIQGARQEKAFENTALALGVGIGWTPGTPPQIPAQNTNFLRADAGLFIIMVSDEDDGSFGPARYYSRLFESYKGAGNEALVSISAIAGPPGEEGGCFDAATGSAAAGDRYAELVSLDVPRTRAGIFTSICADFNESLGELSINATGLNSIFKLSSFPNQSAKVECGAVSPFLCVRVNGTPVNQADRTGWVYDETQNAVVFGVDALPPPQSKITVEYQESRR